MIGLAQSDNNHLPSGQSTHQGSIIKAQARMRQTEDHQPEGECSSSNNNSNNSNNSSSSSNSNSNRTLSKRLAIIGGHKTAHGSHHQEPTQQQLKRRAPGPSPSNPISRCKRKPSPANSDSDHQRQQRPPLLSSSSPSSLSLSLAAAGEADTRLEVSNKSLARAEAEDEAEAEAEQVIVCAACAKPIRERYLLEALNKQWHEDCLKCACCDCRLGEVGSSLFTQADKILCRRDFLRIFGQPGSCAACAKSIPPYELVMRANENAYHMECFACQQCHYRFCVGDRFHLTDSHRIVCTLCHSESAAAAAAAAAATPTTTEAPTTSAQAEPQSCSTSSSAC